MKKFVLCFIAGAIMLTSAFAARVDTALLYASPVFIMPSFIALYATVKATLSTGLGLGAGG